MTPTKIVDALEYRLKISGAPIQLRDSIERELLDSGISPLQAADHVERLCNKVVKEIRRRMDESIRLGHISVLGLRGRDGEIVHGSSYVFADDHDHIAKSKRSRVCAYDIYFYIRSLSFSQFELFGKRVLIALGCRDADVTPHGGDQGIDFFGDLTVGSLLGTRNEVNKLMHETRLVIVGQAKHYPEKRSTIGPAIVRELVGALSLARAATFSKENVDFFDRIVLQPFTPVLALIFSTGEFTKGARRLAEKAGLVAFSGWQLAVFLADLGIGIVDRDGEMAFDQNEFDIWLKGEGA